MIWQIRHSLLLMILLLLPGCPPQTRIGEISFLPARERQILQAINQTRKKNSLPPLVLNHALTRIARRHTADMLTHSRLEHRDANGYLVEQRCDRYRIDWHEVGENVARNRGYENPSTEAVRGWLESPTHRKNILSGRFQETGIGVAFCEKTGYTYFTQVFLRRMPND